MEPNPYQAPLSADVSQSRWSRLFGRFEVIAICGLSVLPLSAAIHRLQLDDVETYRSSPLIAVEIICILAAMALIPALLLRALTLALSREIALACMNVLISLLAFGAFLAAIWIDAPTLIYAT